MTLLLIILLAVVALNVVVLATAIVLKLTFLRWGWEKLTVGMSNRFYGITVEREKKMAAERKIVDERAFVGCPLWIGGLYIFMDNQIHRERAKNRA